MFADNVVFLIQATVPEFTAKEKVMVNAGFELKESFRVPVPDEWRRKKLVFGTGLAGVHWQRGWTGDHKRSRAPGWDKGFTVTGVCGGFLIFVLGLGILIGLLR